MADFQVDFRLDIALLTKYFTGGRTAGRRECASRREAQFWYDRHISQPLTHHL